MELNKLKSNNASYIHQKIEFTRQATTPKLETEVDTENHNLPGAQKQKLAAGARTSRDILISKLLKA